MDDQLVVIAHNSHEMAAAQVQLGTWAEKKVAETSDARAEIEESLRLAVEHKWGVTGLRRAVGIAKKQHEFYRKIAAAVRLGYVIVPNFPVDLFAIRTTKGTPKRGQQDGGWFSDRAHEQESNAPPIGHGSYVDAIPETEVRSYPAKSADGQAITKHFNFATAFRDVAFPITAVKPQILDDTGRAMAAKVFDEIGIGPEGVIRSRIKDPMVIGRIIYRPKKRVVSFLIAWWLTNKDLEVE